MSRTAGAEGDGNRDKKYIYIYIEYRLIGVMLLIALSFGLMASNARTTLLHFEGMRSTD